MPSFFIRNTQYAIRKKGFSMVELMVTVIIVTVCLMSVFRVFSICVRALGEASYSIAALSVLDGKMSLLKEESVKNGGVLAASFSESIKVDNKRLVFTQDIVEWIVEEDEEEELEVKLCSVKLDVKWQSRGRERRLTLNTFLPIEGCAYEF